MQTQGGNTRPELYLLSAVAALVAGCGFGGPIDLGGNAGNGGADSGGRGAGGASVGGASVGGALSGGQTGTGGENLAGAGANSPQCSVPAQSAAPFDTTFRFTNPGPTPLWLWSDCVWDFKLTSCADDYFSPLVRNVFCVPSECSASTPPVCAACGMCPMQSVLVPVGGSVDHAWNGMTYTTETPAGQLCQCHRSDETPAGLYRISVPVWATDPGMTRTEPTYTVNQDFTLDRAGATVEVKLGSGVCTFGMDQTCNDNPAVSSVWGQCLPDGTCQCHTGFTVNSATGRCTAPSPCSPLDPTVVPITLSNVVAVGRHADGTLYVVDQPELGKDRVFASQGTVLQREVVGGSGSGTSGSGSDGLGGTWAIYSVTNSALPFTLKIEWQAGLASSMGIIRGTFTGRDFVIGEQGDLLEVVGADALSGLSVSNLPGLVRVEYVAQSSNGASLLVTRPEYDWSYTDFRLFYGSAERMVEEVVSNVLRARDGGSTWVYFSLDGAQATAYFPSPLGGTTQLPTLTVGTESAELTVLDLTATEGMSFFCLAP